MEGGWEAGSTEMGVSPIQPSLGRVLQKHKQVIVYLSLQFSVLGIKPGASNLVGRQAITPAHLFSHY